MIRRPVINPPVKETKSTRGSSVSGAPAVAPAPQIKFATPLGNPASSNNFIK